MIVSEIKNEIATVRIHNEYYRKETQQAIAEISQIVSHAYQRRLAAATPFLTENISIQTVNH